jgi:hypothetical protein
MEDLLRELQNSEEIDRGLRLRLANLSEAEAESLACSIWSTLASDSRRFWTTEIFIALVSLGATWAAGTYLGWGRTESALASIGFMALVAIAFLAFGRQHENFERLVPALASLEQQSALASQIQVLRLYVPQFQRLYGPVIPPLIARVAASLRLRNCELPARANADLAGLLSWLRLARAPSKEMSELLDACRTFAPICRDPHLLKAIGALPTPNKTL